MRCADLQRLAALGALPHVGIGGHRIGERLLHLVARRQQHVELLGEQRTRVGDNLVFRDGAARDAAHLVFQLGRHLGMRDARRVLVERVAYRHAELRGLDGIVLEVVDNVGVLFAYHVHVCLHDEGLAVFASGGGGAADEDVAGLIDLAVEVVLSGEVYQPCADLAFLLARTRHLGDGIKDFPKDFRFKIFDFHSLKLLKFGG